MTTVTYNISTIHCERCMHKIETAVQDLTGVQSVKADADNKDVQITFDAPASEEAIKVLLENINHPVDG